MARRYEGKVVWITGGGSGIGRACAQAFAREGATVAVSGRREERLAEVAAELSALGDGEAYAVPCDVTDEGAVDGAVRAVIERSGRMDVALANAGYAVSGAFEKLTGQEWRRQLEVNVVGAAMTARYALPALRKTSGRIGLVGSVAAFICAPKLAPYNASKHALRALGLTLSMELHGSGVSCTLVHPGFVSSEIDQVDNSGQFHADRVDRRPKQLMWPADKAAGVILTALHKRRRELVFTGHGKIGAFIGQHLPGVAHLMLSRS